MIFFKISDLRVNSWAFKQGFGGIAARRSTRSPLQAATSFPALAGGGVGDIHVGIYMS